MGGWDYYALCSNGHPVSTVPFGDLFHVHTSICPECGVKRPFKRVVGRYVRKGWFGRRFEEKHVEEGTVDA